MSESPAIHWYSKVALSIPSASEIPEVPAVRIRPTSSVPVIVGCPASGVLTGGNMRRAKLVSFSSLSPSSVNSTLTLMAPPWSCCVTVYVEPVAPGMFSIGVGQWVRGRNPLVAENWRFRGRRASAIPDVVAVSFSPILGNPLMPGPPVGELLAAARPALLDSVCSTR